MRDQWRRTDTCVGPRPASEASIWCPHARSLAHTPWTSSPASWGLPPWAARPWGWQPRGGVDSGPERSGRPRGGWTLGLPPAGHRAAAATFCATLRPRLPGPGWGSSASGEACESHRQPCHGASSGEWYPHWREVLWRAVRSADLIPGWNGESSGSWWHWHAGECSLCFLRCRRGYKQLHHLSGTQQWFNLRSYVIIRDPTASTCKRKWRCYGHSGAGKTWPRFPAGVRLNWERPLSYCRHLHDRPQTAVKTLILGGVRSGKSRLAERLAVASGRRVVYVATAVVGDKEMVRRIQAHRSRRPRDWLVVEEPLALGRVLADMAAPERCLIVDCLTLWLTNLLSQGEPSRLASERATLLAAVPALAGDLVLVGNETNMGVIPLGEISRRYCDEAGLLHQALAARCDRVVLTVAGLPQVLKGPPLDGVDTMLGQDSDVGGRGSIREAGG